jgi:hypothetical protein
MFGSRYENCPKFGVLGGVIFKLDICKHEEGSVLFRTGGGRNETLFNDIVSPMVYV